MEEVVILAAGAGTRFGSPKQLACYRHKPILQHVIDASLGAGYRPWVVLGAHHDSILDSPSVDLSQCQVVYVANWEKGLSESIRTAVETFVKRSLTPNGVLLLLGDQPLIEAQHIKQMSTVARRQESPLGSSETNVIVSASYDGRGGVPAYFSAGLFPDLMALSGDRGARQLIAARPHVLLEWGDVLKDVDRPDDIGALTQERPDQCPPGLE